MKAWQRVWISRSRSIRVLVWSGAVCFLFVLPWSTYKIRDELAIRANARVTRELIRAGNFEAAGEPLTRWLHAKPDSAEARFLSATGHSDCCASISASRNWPRPGNSVIPTRRSIESEESCLPGLGGLPRPNRSSEGCF